VFLHKCINNDYIKALTQTNFENSENCFSFKKHYTGCLKIRELRIQSVVGDHFSSPNMEIKKNRDSSTKIHWSEGALFELRFLQIQAEKSSVYCYLWCR
jgi:hypothetical protein